MNESASISTSPTESELTQLQRSIERRLKLLKSFTESDDLRRAALVHLPNDVVAFFNDWLWTYDPRETVTSAFKPFDLWPKQEDYLLWLEEKVKADQEWGLEKSRDVGASYLNGGFALHHWLFRPGFKTTFGANKQDKVDRLGDPDSIFQKIRFMIDYLPNWMMPGEWDPRKHDLFLRLVNPENGNVITGEAGDNMGRGGRASLYIVDEAAHLERSGRVEAATIAVAECRGWVSSVNGMGNLFARKRHGGVVPFFTLHWRDDPRKTPAWAAEKQATTDPVTWAAEYEIDYSASLEGACIPGTWVASARMLKDVCHVPKSSRGVAGLDVGAGKAESCYIQRYGTLVEAPLVWKDPDTTETALRALSAARDGGIGLLNFDPVGVGAGVNSTLTRNPENGIEVQGINVGNTPTDRTWPDGRSSKEMFGNLKAELWWLCREAIRRSHERVLWELDKDGGVNHPIEDCLALPDDLTLATQLSLPRAFHNDKGKIVMERKDQLRTRGVPSPDRAEALVLAFCEDMRPRLHTAELLL